MHRERMVWAWSIDSYPEEFLRCPWEGEGCLLHMSGVCDVFECGESRRVNAHVILSALRMDMYCVVKIANWLPESKWN